MTARNPLSTLSAAALCLTLALILAPIAAGCGSSGSPAGGGGGRDGAATGGHGGGGATGGAGGGAAGTDAGVDANGGGAGGADAGIIIVDARGNTLTCAELLTCCNSVTDVVLKTACLGEFDMLSPMGNMACGNVLTQIRANGACL